MKRIGVLTSGGDSPGMNAAIRAVVRCGINYGLEVYGIYRGYEGLLDGDIRLLKRSNVGDIMHRGGTMLKTARSKEFMTAEGQDRAVEILDEYGIEALVVIGGDGSLTGAKALADRGVNVMGLPGTIDNDLAYTDFTIGYDTAVNTVLDAISNIRDTSLSHQRTMVIEVMGRHCGDLAMSAALAGGATTVLIPEIDYDIDEICNKIKKTAKRGKMQNLIINAEGSGMKTEELTRIIHDRTGLETRYVVLSYLQRGGNPTAKDRNVATLTAAKAVELIMNGYENKAIGYVDGHVAYFDIGEALSAKREVNWTEYNLINVLGK